MDMGLTGLQMIGGVATSYNADAPVNEQVQIEETSNTVVLEYVVPVHMEIVAFGVYITEDFVAQATDPVVTLKKMSTLGGTETSLKALTLGSGNTSLTKGDDTNDNVTAIAADTDLDNGDVVFANLKGVARVLDPGQIILVEHTTAATGAGGSYVPFVLVKVGGPDFRKSNVWREIESTEAVGD